MIFFYCHVTKFQKLNNFSSINIYEETREKQNFMFEKVLHARQALLSILPLTISRYWNADYYIQENGSVSSNFEMPVW